jgi:hypothetical protein
MARPKKFAQRVLVALSEQTIADLRAVQAPDEDRSDCIREAVELEIAVRRLDVYPDLKAHLLANETLAEFCAKAVRRAVLNRKTSLANEAGPDDGAAGDKPSRRPE